MARTRRSFKEEEIQRALVAVAACSGNSRKAQQDLLAKDGLEITHQTLYNWSRSLHKEEYEAIRAKLLPQLQAHAAEQHRQLAEREMEVSLKLIDRLEKEVDEIPARDLPGGIRNLDTGAAIHRDKSQLLSGQPTERSERTADEVLRAIHHKLGLPSPPQPVPIPLPPATNGDRERTASAESA